MNQVVRPVARLSGSLRVPSDKSIAHRAAILAAIATGSSRIRRYPRGADTLTTLRCLGQLGVEHGWEDDTLIVEGCGLRGLRHPDQPLDCGNSGTTMRLLTGLLASQSFDSSLIGDASLSRRPMERVASPLREMGASVSLKDGHAPIEIKGRPQLAPINYTLSIPSAQVKSAIILAALAATGKSVIVEPLPSRDHTERMLNLEAGLESGVRAILVRPLDRIDAFELEIPGDFSSAAFFVVGASILPESDLEIEGVGVNPTRTGLLEVLEEAGMPVGRSDERNEIEPSANLHIRSGAMRPLTVRPGTVPRLVDEIPVLAVAATQAHGESRFTGIGELRAKESDRIETISDGLGRLGAIVTAGSDALVVRGRTDLIGCPVDSFGDHRIAMSLAIAGLLASGETTIRDAECVEISYPEFWQDLRKVEG